MPRKLVKRMPGRLRAGPPTSAVSMGSMGYGAGGPIWVDANRTRRAPTATELVNDFRSLAYVCVKLNANGVARVPLRLYARTGPRDRKPRRDCRPLKRRHEAYLREHRAYRSMIGSGDEVSEILDHPFVEALRRPNPHFDGHQFLMFLAMSLDVVGRRLFQPRPPE